MHVKDMNRIQRVANCVESVVQWLGKRHPGLCLELSPACDCFSGPILSLRDTYGVLGVHPEHHVGGWDGIANCHLGVMADNAGSVVRQFESAIALRVAACRAVGKKGWRRKL